MKGLLRHFCHGLLTLDICHGLLALLRHLSRAACFPCTALARYVRSLSVQLKGRSSLVLGGQDTNRAVFFGGVGGFTPLHERADPPNELHNTFAGWVDDIRWMIMPCFL